MGLAATMVLIGAPLSTCAYWSWSRHSVVPLVSCMIYLSFMQRFTIDLLGFNLARAMAIAIGIWLLTTAARGQRGISRWSLVDIAVATYLAWVLLLVTLESRELSEIRYHLPLVAGIAAAKLLADTTENEHRWLLIGVAAGGLLTALAAVIQFHISPDLFGLNPDHLHANRVDAGGEIGRATGFLTHPNAAAFHIALGLLAWGHYLPMSDRRARLRWFLPASALSAYGVFLTGSRSGMVGFLLAGVLATAEISGLKRRVVVSVAAGIGLAVLSLFEFFPALMHSLSESLFGRRGELAGDRAGGRLDLWTDAWTVAGEHPVRGNSSHPLFWDYPPHSDFFGVLVDYGFPGLFLFLVLLLCMIRMARRSRLAPALATVSNFSFDFIIVGIVYGVSQYALITNLGYLWIVAGLAFRDTRSERTVTGGSTSLPGRTSLARPIG